ncbi:Sporulation transcription regulator WhiA [Candidatus Syntrophocurvum alkaliphilum]|uniref:Probable cell division protein WhiA n=1 Tax=Candidatus Syntrophocurvum alkaliphilum TaxID=2293317 RepID=A0A6I6DK13_9FIRM|nr:DNA-binding protein WhiA [Candidatus Syntrophocurvum alkaliphilum]QGU00360.1 Sporulation transcription regulator WhiA [Candidatus Syntrophocurvum alkaliphilum]
MINFSNEVKNELARIMPEKDCCKKAEAAAILNSSGYILNTNETILRIVNENVAAARKVFKILKESYDLKSTVVIDNRKRFKKNKVYIIDTILNKENINVLANFNILNDNCKINNKINWRLVGKKCCKRAYIRGLFLVRGFVNKPEGSYHLEIVCNDTKLAHDSKRLLAKCDIEARLTERKSNIIIYLKESEKIVDLLRIIGANKALLEFENVRIIKSMRNNVNRQVNCETANLAKTVDASLRQIELIKKVIDRHGVDIFPLGIKELAMLRIDYPDSTLKELGNMMSPPLTKSGTAYRMRKLERICEQLLEDDYL